jgi:uncharacterized protein (TIGR02646 family)
MRFLERIPLPRQVIQALTTYQKVLDLRIANIARGPERTETITRVWKARRQSTTLQAIEIALKAMASGIARCMYCDEGHGHQIEHFRPKAHYDKETFTWENLLWVCGECNTQKNAEFDDQILNPTLDNPLKHLQLTSEGRFQAPPASRGALTLERLTRLRAQNLIDGRKIAFDHIKLILTELFPVAADESRAKIRQYVINSPFGSVFAAILHASREQDAVEVLGPELISVLSQNPEIYDWLKTADEERRARALIEIDAIAQRIGVDVSEEEDVTEDEA